MDFIKNNYEKIVLGLVLFGLVVAAVLMLFVVASEKDRLEELRNSIVNYRVDPLPEQDLERPETLLKRASTPIVLNFSDASHKLFNPVIWGKTPDNRIVKIDVENPPSKLEVLNPKPLLLVVTLDSVLPFETGIRYVIGVEQQAAPKPANRPKKATPASVNEKKDMFIIRAVEGPADNPTNVVIELTDSGERISVGKEKPFRRVDGYVVDLRYPPTNQSFVNRRKDDNITFAGDTYKITSITRDLLVLMSPNQKKWPIPFKTPNPAAP
jgi:hypothetical protein